MKILISTFMALSFYSSMAFASAPISVSRESVSQVVQTYNSFYPTLQLSVAKPAAEDVLLNELEVLGDSLNGEDVPAGELVHLACCAVACGGSGCIKK